MYKMHENPQNSKPLRGDFVFLSRVIGEKRNKSSIFANDCGNLPF